MCVTCVATGAAHVVPALVGLKVHATRLRRRRPPVPEPSARPALTRTARVGR
ncbi:MAG: hypothetical protein WD232_00670 [Acidimicrobiales bacterium]